MTRHDWFDSFNSRVKLRLLADQTNIDISAIQHQTRLMLYYLTIKCMTRHDWFDSFNSRVKLRLLADLEASYLAIGRP